MIEEFILFYFMNFKMRLDVLLWYVMVLSLGLVVGIEMLGRVVEIFCNLDGWDILSVYYVLFWVYVVMGLFNVFLVVFMSFKCELNDLKLEGEGEVIGEFV